MRVAWNDEKKFLLLILVVFLIKLVLAGCFSSEYQDKLFVPFINLFLSGYLNPWEYALSNNLNLEFPYHPLMLYFYSIGAMLIKFFHIKSVFIGNILFKLPTFIADFSIFYLLLKSFKKCPYKVLCYYFLSPIIIYASYMHSQLDLVPVALLFISCYFLRNFKIYKASLFFAFALCTKFTAFLILPILIAYIFKNYSFKKAVNSLLIIVAVYGFISLPFIFSAGYQNLVLMNAKQNLFFDMTVNFDKVVLYIPLGVVLISYLRFFVYKRINTELFDSYIVATLSVILLLIPPTTPAWYIWLIPFLCIFVIKYSEKNIYISVNYVFLAIIYLLYFVFFHIGDYQDLSYFSIPVNLKLNNVFIGNVLYTCLETILVMNIYMVYKIGIKNNRVYKPTKAIVIGIGGDSGSGKTTLSKQLKILLGDSFIPLEGDNCHKWERNDENWTKYTHLDPKANFLHNQFLEISKLKSFKPVIHSDYNHQTGTFDTPVKIMPKPFIILSGLHSFYLPKMRKIIDIKIYLSPDENLRKYWKIQRDTQNRNYTVEKVLKNIEQRQKDADMYITPQKNFADLIIEFYPQDNFDFLKTNTELNLNLKIILNSNVNIQDFLEFLDYNHIEYTWDYSNDLKSQYLILTHTYSDNMSLDSLIKEDVNDLREITKKEVNLSTGLEGVVDFIILRLISEKLKEIYD